MKSDSDSMPLDINELTSLVKELREQVAHQSLFIDQLLEQIKLARHQRFGVRSEHLSPDQLRLLLEDNDKEPTPVDDDPADSDQAPSSQPRAKSRKRGRRNLPDHLPRVEVEHTLDEQACRCEHCQSQMEPLSQKITKQCVTISLRHSIRSAVRRQI